MFGEILAGLSQSMDPLIKYMLQADLLKQEYGLKGPLAEAQNKQDMQAKILNSIFSGMATKRGDEFLSRLKNVDPAAIVGGDITGILQSILGSGTTNPVNGQVATPVRTNRVSSVRPVHPTTPTTSTTKTTTPKPTHKFNPATGKLEPIS